MFARRKKWTAVKKIKKETASKARSITIMLPLITTMLAEKQAYKKYLKNKLLAKKNAGVGSHVRARKAASVKLHGCLK